MASKKTSRSRQPAPSASSPDETGHADRPVVARRRPAAAKAPPAAKVAARRVATRPKRAAKAVAPRPNAVQPQVVVTDDEIRVRAYFLSVEYQGPDRNDVDFWLLAERELRPAEESND